MRRDRALLLLLLGAVACNAIVGIDPPTVGEPDGGDASTPDAPGESGDVTAPPHDASAEAMDAADTGTDATVEDATDGEVEVGPAEASSADSGGGVDAGVDSGAGADSGAGVDAGAGTDSSADSGAGADSGADAAVDTGLDTGVDTGLDTGIDAPTEAGTITCTTSTPVPASVSLVNEGPSLAYSPATGLWGLSWSGTTTILYNAVDSSGNIQNASDATVAPAATGTTYGSPPKLTALGSTFVVAYGVKNKSGSAFPAVQLVTPATGAPVGSAADGTSASDTVSNAVGGVSVDDTGDAIVTASRGGALATATVARANLFTTAPALGSSQSPSSSTYATAVTWAGGTVNLFGVAYLTGSTSSGGTIATYTSTLGVGASYPFTEGVDQPAVGLSGYDVSVAAAGSNFVVAWVDSRNGENEIWVTSVDAQTGAHLSPTSEVQASVTSTHSKSYPRVVWDGRSIVVGWLEPTGTSTYDVMIRRYDPSLDPLEMAPWCVSCGAGNAEVNAIDLAVAGPDDYGVAFSLQSPVKQFFTHVTCTGP